MSHRENSLTPHFGQCHPDVPPATWDGKRWSDDAPNSDDEKHMFCLRRTGAHATFLPPSIYDRASAQGCDMRWFVKQEPIPEPLGKTHIGRMGRPVRKHISEKTCHGKDVACLPGLNGQCVACFDDD